MTRYLYRSHDGMGAEAILDCPDGYDPPSEVSIPYWINPGRMRPTTFGLIKLLDDLEDASASPMIDHAGEQIPSSQSAPESLLMSDEKPPIERARIEQLVSSYRTVSKLTTPERKHLWDGVIDDLLGLLTK